MMGLRWIVWRVSGVLLLAAAPASAFDEALYAEILKEYTQVVSDPAGTRVDYPALEESEDWQRLVWSFARTDRASLRTRDEKLAFWINAYNVAAIDVVVRHYPVDSIRDIGSFFWPVWKKKSFRVDAEPYSLDEIEKGILGALDEPRVHAALVCASTSCPSLLREPWEAGRLDAQFGIALRRWLADPRKGMRIDRDRRVVTLSRIFKWYSRDFEDVGGVLRFVSRYVSSSDRDWILANRRGLTLRYFDYDWSLNETR